MGQKTKGIKNAIADIVMAGAAVAAAGYIAYGLHVSGKRPDVYIEGVVTGEDMCYRPSASDGHRSLPVYRVKTSEGKRIVAGPYACEHFGHSEALPHLERGDLVRINLGRGQQPIRREYHIAPHYYLLRPEQVSVTGKLSAELTPADEKDEPKPDSPDNNIRVRDLGEIMGVLKDDLKRKLPN